jgi:hypothetical protein
MSNQFSGLARNAATLPVDFATLWPFQMPLAIFRKLNCRKLGLYYTKLFLKRVSSEEYDMINIEYDRTPWPVSE